jgi:hypothetical protein
MPRSRFDGHCSVEQITTFVAKQQQKTNANMTTLEQERPFASRSTLLSLAIILLAYVLLHMKYYIYYVDDAWFVSENYYYCQTGKIEDVLFRAVDAPDRVLLFGKTYFQVYGNFMEWFGWTKGNAILLSSIFTWLSAWFWWRNAKLLGFSEVFSRTVGLSVLILPAFFNAAMLTRPDAFVFFLSAATFWAFLKKIYPLSGFLLLVSVESHLMGITGAFFILAYVLATWRSFFDEGWKLPLHVLLFLVGAGLGAYYFYWLHPDFTFERLNTILSIKKGMNDFEYGYIVKYFTQHFWYRHVWELPVLFTAIYLFVKNRLWKDNLFIPVFFTVAVLSSFVTSRPNANYMVFIYPAFVFFGIYVFEKTGLLKKLSNIVAVLLLVLYGAHYFAHRTYDFNRIITETKAALPQDGLTVIGMPDNWFAAMDRPFHPIYHSVDYIPELGIKEFYLIRNDYISQRSRNYHDFIAWCHANYEVVPLKKFNAYKDKQIEVFHCKPKQNGPQVN